VTPLDYSTDSSAQVRYRIRSLGRADHWYDMATKDENLGVGAASFPETATSWMDITTAPTGNPYGTFDSHPNAAEEGTQVVASATSWSAISLTWVPQSDPDANLYLIYRDVVAVTGDDWKLVGTVLDPDPTDGADLEYVDTHLERNTAYKYRILPTNTAHSPNWSDPNLTYGYSNEATTSIY